MASLQIEEKLLDNSISFSLVEPGLFHTGFNQYMIENKNNLSGSLFTQTLESISSVQQEEFSLIEKKHLSSIVNKMYQAIESDSNKLIYRAPFFQVLGAKLYILFFK